MPTFKFICEHRNLNTFDLDSKTILETNKESLYDVLEEFERFLKGAGFVFEGQLDIVNEDAGLIKTQVDDYSDDTINLSSLSGEDLMFDYEGAAFTDDIVVPNEHASFNIDLNDNMSSTLSIDSPQSAAWPFPANERPQ